MAMKSLDQASKPKPDSKTISAAQQQQQKLASQQTQHKRSLSQGVEAKPANPTPWKRGMINREGKQLGQGDNKPGPQVAKDRIQDSARNRAPQSAPSQQAPSQEMGEQKQSRGMKILMALLSLGGQDGFGAQVMQKYQQLLGLKEAFKKERRPAKPYDPAKQKEIAKKAPERDQKSISLREKLAQRGVGFAKTRGLTPKADQPQQKVEQQKPAEAPKPKKDLSGFKKNKDIGKSKGQTLAD